MSTDIQIFNHPEFGDVRTIGDFENPRFCLADVCRILELPQVAKVVQRLNKDVLSTHPLETAGGVQEMYFVNEDGLYDVILDSRKPNAKKFRKWITSEVIPSIRKHGVYMTTKAAEEILSNPDFIIELAQQVKTARAQIEVLNTQVAELQTKANYCDVVLQCKELVTTSVIAKDYGYSAKAFNKLLHELGVQFRQSDIWLLYQEYAAQGWSQTKTHIYYDEDGKPHSKPHMYWTQKGRLGLYELLKAKNILPLIEQ